MGSLPENYRLSYYKQRLCIYGCIKPIVNNVHEGKWVFFSTQGVDEIYIKIILSGLFMMHLLRIYFMIAVA
jgi:hypothetical protein